MAPKSKKGRSWWGWAHEVQPESYAFYQGTQVKNGVFVIALTAAFLYASAAFEPLPAPPATSARLAAKLLMALVALSMVFVSVNVMPPPIFKPREDRWVVMKLVGSPAYVLQRPRQPKHCNRRSAAPARAARSIPLSAHS